MSEYIITIKHPLSDKDGNQIVNPLEIDRNEVVELPEIVRCRDCKHRAGANVQAVVSDLCMWLDIIVKPDGFCAWGEKKGKLDNARNIQ